MSQRLDKPALAVAAALVVMAILPLTSSNDYALSFGINLLQFSVLATAWALFSGPTRYISLATTAFYGVGAYTVAVLGEQLPWPMVLLAALALGSLLAWGVGGALLLSRVLHVATVVVMAALAAVVPLGPIYLTGVAVVALLLAYEQSLVSATDLSKAGQAFNLNGYVGILYMIFTAVALYVR